MATLEQAIAFAAKQHAGQVDKANAHYRSNRCTNQTQR